MYFRDYRLQKAWLPKWIKSTVSEDFWTFNMLKSPKHF